MMLLRDGRRVGGGYGCGCCDGNVGGARRRGRGVAGGRRGCRGGCGDGWSWMWWSFMVVVGEWWVVGVDLWVVW